MSYFIDLSTVSLQAFFKKINEVCVLPSQKSLRENPEEKLQCLLEQGLRNAEELLAALKTKKQLKAFSEKSGLPEDYLVQLLRELNRYQPEPAKLKDFIKTDRQITEKLEKYQIINTRQLFDLALTPQARKELAEKTRIPVSSIQDLARLSDLSRIMWVSPAFAELLLACGYDSAKKVAEADHKELYQKLISTNEGKSYYKGRIAENDISLLIRYAMDVPAVLIW